MMTKTVLKGILFFALVLKITSVSGEQNGEDGEEETNHLQTVEEVTDQVQTPEVAADQVQTPEAKSQTQTPEESKDQKQNPEAGENQIQTPVTQSDSDKIDEGAAQRMRDNQLKNIHRYEDLQPPAVTQGIPLVKLEKQAPAKEGQKNQGTSAHIDVGNIVENQLHKIVTPKKDEENENKNPN